MFQSKDNYQMLFESEDEEGVRKNFFEKWFSVMTAHNENPHKSFTMGLNQFSDQVRIDHMIEISF